VRFPVARFVHSPPPPPFLTSVSSLAHIRHVRLLFPYLATLPLRPLSHRCTGIPPVGCSPLCFVSCFSSPTAAAWLSEAAIGVLPVFVLEFPHPLQDFNTLLSVCVHIYTSSDLENRLLPCSIECTAHPQTARIFALRWAGGSSLHIN
jgi:hypothetical protein